MAICLVCGKHIQTDMNYHLQSYHYRHQSPGTTSIRYSTKPWLAMLLNILPPLGFVIYFWLEILQPQGDDSILALLPAMPLGFGLGYLYLRRPGRFALAAMGAAGAIGLSPIIYFGMMLLAGLLCSVFFGEGSDPAPGWFGLLGIVPVVLTAMPSLLLPGFTAWDAWDLARWEA